MTTRKGPRDRVPQVIFLPKARLDIEETIAYLMAHAAPEVAPKFTTAIQESAARLWPACRRWLH